MLGSKDNLLKYYTDENCFEHATIKLVDFGFSSRYLDNTGALKKKKRIETFRGNIIFSSIS